MGYRILVAPLDWGLGHATRCIPIIHFFLQNNHKIFIAAEGKTELLLKTEFPAATFIPLKGYRVRYSKKGWLLPLRMLAQVPKLLSIIRHEHNWLKKVVEQHWIDVVISDNRYGLHHPAIRSVFITHQLTIKAPFIFEQALQRLNFHFINRFHECWVPDFEGALNLAGKLSHPSSKPKIPVHYIGLLSRFKSHSAPLPEKHLLILLSGPEPQRTLLEKKLLSQLASFHKPVVLVRGLPGETGVPKTSATVSVFNHLPLPQMEAAIRSAEYVLARCGYSTVMDLVRLQKRSILIPTPGQTEQAYLARHLGQQKLALCLPQSGFVLEDALTAAAQFPYNLSSIGDDELLLQRACNRMLEEVKKGF